MRERRLRRHIAADTEKAALRNVANLDWALRQNVEDAFRRFENSFALQLSQALNETRQALQIALQKRSARAAEVGDLVAQSEQSTTALARVLSDLKDADAF
jgi:predicted transcriptional regulator